jgi:hypothetical protein
MQCLQLLWCRAFNCGGRLERILTCLVVGSLLSSSSLSSAATLSVSYDYLWPGTNNLSQEGTLDWGQWGLVNEFSYNHKYGVPQQITYSFITDYADYPAWDGPFIFDYRYGYMLDYSWTDGTPSRAVEDTWNAVTMYGDKLQPDNNPAGFRIQCKADTSPRTLKIYLSGGGGRETKFAARLTGALDYDHIWSDGYFGNRVYTLNFQADSPGETLTAEFTCGDHWWYLTLDAATLAGTNSPPTVAITAPADSAVLSSPATFALTAAAADAEGTVTNLSLFRGATLLKKATSGAASVTLSNQAPGICDFFAVATDNGGLSRTSFPVRVCVKGNGGTLVGSVEPTPPGVDLTAEGTADWAHWGLTSPLSFDRKAAVPQRIPNISLLNASSADLNNYTNYSGDVITYSWSDGTPTSGADSPTGIFLWLTNNPTAGFQLIVPAATYRRTLKVYVGLSYAQGKLDAWLTDFSALPYSDASVFDTDNDANAVYSLTFASPTPGANLVVTWTPVDAFNIFYANLNWQAATLSEQVSAPVLRVVYPPPATNRFALSFFARTGATYNVQFTTNLGSGNWQPLTNFAGTGADALITDRGIGVSRRFYRVLMQ